MSNFLCVRRVKVQEIDEEGREIGAPDYGILASDNYEQQFTVAYRDLDELNQAIRDAGNILDVVGGFETLSRKGIGFENYSGLPSGVDADSDPELSES
jgi:hypothetical protein